MAQSKQDMGSGNVRSLMLQLMIPAVVAQVVNLLYNIVDRIYIGHIAGIGAAALTGVGLFTPILMLLNAFAMLVGAGGAPRTAIALGQGDKKQAEKIISNSFTMLLLFSVVLTIGFYAGAPMLLRLFGASDATLPYALSYSRIYLLGSVFVLLVLGMNPFITTQGFAKTSMLTTVIGAVINIILDPILIFGFGLGVRGAAIATVASQVVSAVLCIIKLTRSDGPYRLEIKRIGFDLPLLKKISSQGVPSGVQNSIIAIANSHISGRKLGAPLTNMSLSILRDKSYERMDYHLHYYSINVNGKDLRSSTFFIKDSGELIGLLCINFDDSRYRDVCDRILSLCHPDLFVTDVLAQPLPENEDGVSARSSPEKFRNSADAVALDAINRELERMGVTPEQLTPEKRLQVIAALESGGLFLLKGAVKSAAASLHCSPASVYRYITQIKNSDSGQI